MVYKDTTGARVLHGREISSTYDLSAEFHVSDRSWPIVIDHPHPNLASKRVGVVQDLCGTDPPQEIRRGSYRLYSSHRATWARDDSDQLSTRYISRMMQISFYREPWARWFIMQSKSSSGSWWFVRGWLLYTCYVALLALGLWKIRKYKW